MSFKRGDPVYIEPLKKRDGGYGAFLYEHNGTAYISLTDVNGAIGLMRVVVTDLKPGIPGKFERIKANK